MNRLELFLSFIIFIMLPSILGCNQPRPQVLTIAAAANVQYALDSLVEVFERDAGVDCEVVISSSGKLTAQISKGAPYDIFLSADMKYPEALFRNGFVKDKPIVYAQGSLVLWKYEEGDAVDLWQMIASDKITNVAMANPKTAPYGTATMKALKTMDILESIERKLIYGESIAQTNHFITSGAADMGFTAKSVVLTPEMRAKGRWIEVDPTYYQPIDQGMAIVNHAGYEVAAAQKFYEFMLSEKAQLVLRHFGYQSSK